MWVRGCEMDVEVERAGSICHVGGMVEVERRGVMTHESCAMWVRSHWHEAWGGCNR